MNSFSLVSASPEFGGKCRACEAIGACLRTQVKTFNNRIFCLDSSLYPVLFVSLFPIAFYRRSRMTGRFLIPFCKKPFLLSTHAYSFRQLR